MGTVTLLHFQDDVAVQRFHFYSFHFGENIFKVANKLSNLVSFNFL